MKKHIVFIVLFIPLFCWGMKDEDVFPKEHDPEEIIIIKTNDQSASDDPIKVTFKIASQMQTIKNLIDEVGSELTGVPVHPTLLKKLIDLLEKYPEEKVDEVMERLIAQIKLWDEDLVLTQKTLQEDSQEVKNAIEKEFEAMRAQADYRFTIDREETPLLFKKELAEESFATLIQLLNAANYLEIPKLLDLLLEHALLKKVTDKDLVELNELNINLPSSLRLKMSQRVIKPRVIKVLKTKSGLNDIALSCNGTYLSMSYGRPEYTEIWNRKKKEKKSLERAVDIKFDTHDDALLYYNQLSEHPLLAGSDKICRYDLKKDTSLESWPLEHSVDDFAVSSDDQWIALSSQDLEIFDKKKRVLVHSVNLLYMKKSSKLFFTPDNKAIISNAFDHRDHRFVLMYNVETGKLIRTFERYEKDYEAYCVLNTKKMYLAACAWLDKEQTRLWGPLKIWKLDNGVCIKNIELKGESLAFSADGELLAVFGDDSLKILETSGWNILHSLPLKKNSSKVKLVFHPNNELIFIGFLGLNNNSIKVVELHKSKLTTAQIAYIMHHEQNNGVVRPKWTDHYNSLDETIKDAITPGRSINITEEGETNDEATIDSSPNVEAAKVKLLSTQSFKDMRKLKNINPKEQAPITPEQNKIPEHNKNINPKEQAPITPEQNKIPEHNKASLWNRFLNWWRGKK